MYGDDIKIAVGRHSDGTGAVMTMAGAIREIGGMVIAPYVEPFDFFEDDCVDAFIVLSPTGPNYAGFLGTNFLSLRTSWDDVTHPFLTPTSGGNNQCDVRPAVCGGKATPWSRWAPHRFMPDRDDGPDANYRLYVDDVTA